MIALDSSSPLGNRSIFGGAQPMHMLKLVLPLAGLLIAGQTLAHKASHAAATVRATIASPMAQSGSIPAALLDGVGGRSAQAASAVPATDTAEATGKKHRYTHFH